MSQTMAAPGKKLFSTWMAFLLISPVLVAGAKEDAARDLLRKSFQQANIWTQGPVQLVATVRLPRPNAQDISLVYTISWAKPDKWRAEWSGAGYSRVIVVNDGKLYRFSSSPAPPLPVLEFEGALGALTGHGMGGLSLKVRTCRRPKLKPPRRSSEKPEQTALELPVLPVFSALTLHPLMRFRGAQVGRSSSTPTMWLSAR